ncbi:MAG: two-component sensor histidine kinase [Nitrosomonadales bacterium]|nr:MAG: two-component sensor histidine kinase [Nitrosomonadales bacterium]
MSLNARIILAASIVLAVFLALTGIVLDQAFRESARAAREERLQGQLYMLIAEAEVDQAGRLEMPAKLQEPRLDQPFSGLYAAIADGKGKMRWRSPSALNVELPPETTLAAGKSVFSRLPDSSGTDYFVYRMGVSWSEGKRKYAFTFSVAEDLSAFHAQLARYRRSLWGWLGAMAGLLLLAQAMLLRWGLRPLRDVAQEIRAIEAGEKEQLSGTYPAELSALTGNLNGLLLRERAQLRRYRDALGDLAHSLKTPLAVMRGALSEQQHEPESLLAATVAEETGKMQHIVDYQLQRAATAGPASPLAAPLPLRPLAEKIAASLEKVYHAKQVSLQLHIAPGLNFRGDRGDLLELLGNLLDNACKWCHARVELHAGSEAGHLALAVEDDGPGIPAQEAANILQRGVRADQSTPGQGIGLAMVASIVQAYGGEIRIGESPLGGARVVIRIPC